MALNHVRLVSDLVNDDVFHCFFLPCSENEGYDLPVIGHDQLVDKIHSLLIDVTSHDCVFKVLKAVVDVNTLLDLKGWPVSSLSLLARV